MMFGLRDSGLIELLILPFSLFIAAIVLVKLILALPRRRSGVIAERMRMERHSRRRSRPQQGEGFRRMR